MSASSRSSTWFPVRTAFAVAAALLVSAALWFATSRLDVQTGFSAQYFDGPDEGAAPVVRRIDARLSTALGRPGESDAGRWRRARWDAVLRIETAGTYRLSLLSADAAQVFLDDRLIVNHSPGVRQTTVSVALDRGVHALRVACDRTGEEFLFELLWAPTPDGRLTPLTGAALAPTGRTRSEYRLGRALEITRLVLVVVWTLGYWALIGRCVVAPLWRALIRHHAPQGLPRPLLACLGVVALLYAVGMRWGWPGPGWVPNEMATPELFGAIDAKFSSGWWSWYGPVHYYVLTIVTLPLYIWHRLDGDAFYAALGFDWVLLIGRAVSVAMAVAAVLMMYLCGLFVSRGRVADTQRLDWPAFVAAALASLSMPMVFYAKAVNMDMPYVFWFTLFLVSLARIASENSKPDYVLFAVTGMLAVCTKDQAYGLFGLPALGVAVHACRTAPGESLGGKLTAVARDRWVLMAVAAGVGTFVLGHNLVVNWSGFITHFRYIQTGGIDGFRMFTLSADGLWQLWRASWMLIRVSVGWPAFLLMLAGLAASLAPGYRRLWWMLLPAVSYFVTYAVIVRYTYDRFLLPVLLMLALATAVVAAALEQFTRGGRWPRIVAGVAIAYTFVYVVAVDVAIVGDSRYAAERWIHTHAQPGARFGLVGGPEYMPRLDGFFGQVMRPAPGDLETPSFDYIVLNLDWVKRFGPDRPEHALFAGLQNGRYAFRPVFEAGADTRVAGMRFLDRFAPFGDVGYSTFTKIDPPLVIYERVP